MSKNIYIDYLAEQPESNNHYLNRLLKILRYSTEKEVSHQIGYEEHHIVPKSWKPEWKRVKDNMIYLPTRLHFIIHWLYALAFPRDRSMTFAFWRMINQKRFGRIKSRLYLIIREQHKSFMSELLTGRVSPTKGMKMPRSSEHSANISKAKKGCSVSLTQRKAISEAFQNTIWITDGNDTKRIKSSDPIPDGWKKGRGEQSVETKIKRAEEVRGRVANGTHHLLGTVSAFNINTKEIKRIPKEEFYSNSDIWVSTFKKYDYVTN